MLKTVIPFSQQCKAEAYQRIEAILETGPFIPGIPRAVHGAHFVYTLKWAQARARISEMNDLGWVISSIELPKDQWRYGIRTGYRLDSKPLTLEPPRVDSDYMRRVRQEQSTAMPLFAGGKP